LTAAQRAGAGALPVSGRTAYTAAVDSGAPPASNRAASRTSVGGVAKPPGANAVPPKAGAAKPNGTGSTRHGPIDPRTEDPSAPGGISRAGKTVWRRPGSSTPRPGSQHDTGGVESPIEFSVATPLAPEPTRPVEAPSARTVEVQPVALAPTVEVVNPSPTAPTMLSTVLVPAALVPQEPAPTEQRTMPVPAPILYDEAATIDDVTQIGPVLETRPLRRPINFRRAPKPRIRRVTRVVRHVDTWSVFKVALVFNVFFYAVTLVAGVLLWQVAYATGTIDNVEKFFEGFGWETFNFNGGQIFHNAWIAGLFVAVGLTGLAVLLATLFNLITDLVGGVRFSVLEEEVQARAERGTELITDAGATDQGDVEVPIVETTDPAIAG
jgi:Transmembrane domain of unknown function (DUF3566)